MLLALLTLIALQLPAVAAGIPKLAAPPEGERWFSINMGGERVGFARQSIARTGDGYRIESESSVKMRGSGFSREGFTKEWYLVGPDLTVRSFSAELRIDGSPMVTSGEVGPGGIKLAIESRGGKKERTLKTKSPVYPPQAMNIYPLLVGAVAGKSYKVPMLDLESAKVKQVKIKVIKEETLPPGTVTVHLQNDLYPIVDNDIWVDLQGNTVKESVRDDFIVTLAEDQAAAKLRLADAALSKKDMVLELSLVPVNPPIERPEQLKRLSVELSGIPEALPLLQGKGQKTERLPNGAVVFTMPNPGYAPAEGKAATEPAEGKAATEPAEGKAVTAPTEGQAATTPDDLAPATRIPSDAKEIIALKDEIVDNETDPAVKVKLLAGWVAREIKGTVTDSQSPLETLSKRNGNCQSHSRLYTALARAAGIPTRFVSGLVYSPGQGFLYHSWAESYLDGWIPVDPTFGEVPANATHIKFVEGDSPDEMGGLASMIGRVRAKVVEKKY